MVRIRKIRAWVTFATLTGLFFMMPISVSAADEACHTATEEYHKALQTVMKMNSGLISTLSSFLKDTKKSAKKYKAASSEVAAAIKDNRISNREKKKMFKMKEKLEALKEPYYKAAVVVGGMRGYIKMAEQKGELMKKVCK